MAASGRDRAFFWQDLARPSVLAQLLFLGVLCAIAAIGWGNLTTNLRRLNLDLSFDFLRSQASFPLRETLIDFRPTDSYARALGVGLLNTLRVTMVAIVGATGVGVTAGIARLSSNWLVRMLAAIYVEALRNTPLLLQLLFWYLAVFLTLPPPNAAVSLLGVATASNAGIALPALHVTFSSEFCALVLGLTVYTGTFIAEIVRGGILSVPQGQWEAARALGLQGAQVMRLVVFPQALRAIVPPLTSQYLNIAKNSSLAIAVAFEDLYAVASTTFNQTGRSVQVVLLLAVTYLAISLAIAAIGNAINARISAYDRVRIG